MKTINRLSMKSTLLVCSLVAAALILGTVPQAHAQQPQFGWWSCSTVFHHDFGGGQNWWYFSNAFQNGNTDYTTYPQVAQAFHQYVVRNNNEDASKGGTPICVYNSQQTFDQTKQEILRQMQQQNDGWNMTIFVNWNGQ